MDKIYKLSNKDIEKAKADIKRLRGLLARIRGLLERVDETDDIDTIMLRLQKFIKIVEQLRKELQKCGELA